MKTNQLVHCSKIDLNVNQIKSIDNFKIVDAFFN